MKIKVKEIVEGCMPVRTNGDKSDCFDLSLAEDIKLKKGEVYVASLGVAMELPKGFTAYVFSRSSCPSKLGIGIANGVGVIDNSYKSEEDIWRAPIIAYKTVEIPKGTRICQFTICPNQFSTIIDKLKWFFGKLKLVKVTSLNGDTRGGIGSSGLN